MEITADITDRSVGLVLASCLGDALGAGYEYQEEPIPDEIVFKDGGEGRFKVGEWTDDTAMAWGILQVLASGKDLLSEEGQELVLDNWLTWYEQGAKGSGRHTRTVLEEALRAPVGEKLEACRKKALEASVGGNAAANGSLMRTGVVTLAYLDDPVGLHEAARAVSAVTHPDDRCQDACVLWTQLLRHTVLTGSFPGRSEVEGALSYLPQERREFWSEVLVTAERYGMGANGGNGYVVATLSDAWVAVKGHGEGGIIKGLEAAIRAGGDTDTVAAIAGMMLGAKWGSSALPLESVRLLHGWPGLKANDLADLAALSVREGKGDSVNWPLVPSLVDYYAKSYVVNPKAVGHVDDPGLLLGTTGTLPLLLEEPSLVDVDVVVSLCRVGSQDVPAHMEHLRVWLLDSPNSEDNPNLDFILQDTVQTLLALRAEGKRVLLHCVAAESRTPTVAALYGEALTGRSALSTLELIKVVLPQASPKKAFMNYLSRGTR